MVSNNSRLSIREAAKVVHCRRSRVKQLIEEGKVTAWRVGGTEKKPRLNVDVEELRRVVDRENLYVPTGFTRSDVVKRRRSSSLSSSLDPTALDL